MKTIAAVVLTLMPAIALANGPQPDPHQRLAPPPTIEDVKCDAEVKYEECTGYLSTTTGQLNQCISDLAKCSNVDEAKIRERLASKKEQVATTAPAPAKKAKVAPAPRKWLTREEIKKLIADETPECSTCKVDVNVIVAAVLAKLPPPTPADPRPSLTDEERKALIAEILALIPAPKDGKDGRDGAAIFQLVGIGSTASAFKVPDGYARAVFLTAELSIRVAEIANLTLTGGWAWGQKQAAFGEFALDVYPFAGARWLGFSVGGHAQWLDINQFNYSKYQYLAFNPAIVLRSTNDHGLKVRGVAGPLIGVEGRRSDMHETNGLIGGLAIGF